jgi:hypothetical protein
VQVEFHFDVQHWGMEWVLLWLGLSVVIGIAAAARGRSGFGYLMLAVVASPLISGVLLALLPARNAHEDATDQCPECAERVHWQALKCKHCGVDLRPYRQAAQQAYNERMAAKKAGNRSG